MSERILEDELLPPDSVDYELEDVQGLESVVLPEVTDRRLILRCVEGTCLNVRCFRGFAPAYMLSAISQPDVYNQFSNPDGTQRELSVRRAKEAYAYMDVTGADANIDQRFVPEVVLNIRNKEVVEIDDRGNGYADVIILLDQLSDDEEDPDISRVEGNHRLTYARGFKSMQPLGAPLSFCLMDGVPKLMEAKLFRDINSKQKAMQTSHLDNIDIRLDGSGGPSASEHLKLAYRLSEEHDSAFYHLVYKGGRKAPGQRLPITLRSLSTLVKVMQSKSDKLARCDLEEQYLLLKTYWRIISEVFKEEWNDREGRFLMMRSAGTIALALAGASTIDDLIILGKLTSMPEYLEPLRGRVDWRKDGPAQGLNGVGGATQIYKRFLLPFLATKNVDAADLKQQIRLLNDI